MSRVVFFSSVSDLANAASLFGVDRFANQSVLVKLHMGEKGNQYFPQPSTIGTVVAMLKRTGASPFLYDTTVAYPGSRKTAAGYLKLAKRFGFGDLGCEIVIDDTGTPVEVEGRTYSVGATLARSRFLFCFSHVKGHIQTGMGGAIKNFGMGGVTADTKRFIHHGSRPVHTSDRCTSCGVCAELCPFEAIDVEGARWTHDEGRCFGCGVCVNACEHGGIVFQDAELQYLLACAAKACVQGKTVLYCNELLRIARSCDCDADAGPIVCPDIGYLLSDDPVAIDAASLDLINAKEPDVFRRVNGVDPSKQLSFGEQIGLGSSSYELTTLPDEKRKA